MLRTDAIENSARFRHEVTSCSLGDQKISDFLEFKILQSTDT